MPDTTAPGRTIGAWTCHAVMTGTFKLDGGAMFGSVPKALWDRSNPSDEQNRIQLATRSLLLRGHGRVVLVDLGCGTKFSEKETGMFAIDHSQYTLDAELARLGLQVADITDCIITHLHFDHAGGSTLVREPGGKPEVSLPNATFHLQKRNLDTATAPNMREQASYLPDTVGPVAALKDVGRLNVIDGDGEILPGLRARISHGHTDAMQCIEVRNNDGGLGLLYAADLVPSIAHVKLPFCMGYDLCVRTLMDEKRSAFEELIESDGILFFEHDPGTAACTLTRGKRHYEPAEVMTNFED